MRRRRSEVANSVEDETLTQIAKEAEVRLAKKRAARIEARKMRMQELIKNQCEHDKANSNGVRSEDKNNRAFASPRVSSPPPQGPGNDFAAAANNLESSSSNPELKAAFDELQEKYRQAMVYSAQLENERSQLQYQCQLFKDLLEEQEDDVYRLTAEHRSTIQELERQKRSLSTLEKKCFHLQEVLQQREQLIQEKDLSGSEVIGESVDGRTSGLEEIDGKQAGGYDLDSQLKVLAEEKQELLDKVRMLEEELGQERRKEDVNGQKVNDTEEISDIQLLEIQREANRQVSEYKLKLQKSEQDITSLRDHISRLESHLHRLKQSTEVFEKNEDEMRAEKRKLARDLRTALDRIEELQMSNHHLEKRLERIRATRAAMSMT